VASQFLIVVRREHRAAISNAAVLQHPASSQVGRAPSTRLAPRWAAPAVQADPEDGLDLAGRARDLADLRVPASVVLDRALLVAHHRRLRLGVRSVLRRAAVRVVSNSIRRLKKGR
jgi:hypothetical protein